MELSDFRGKISAQLPKIMLILCLVQPLLDVLSFWQDQLGLSNVLTTVLRFALLAAVTALGFVLSRKKRHYIIMAAVLLALTAGHAAACHSWGYGAPVEDLANLLRIYQLPLMTLSFITFLQLEPRVFARMKQGFVLCLLICGAVTAVSVVTGTDPWTYPDKEVGFLGWFYFPNSQSAILSMLVPVALIAVKDQKRKFAAVALLGFGLLFSVATRLAYLSLIASYAGMAVCLALIGRQKGSVPVRQIALLLVLAAVAAGCFGICPMTRNSEKVAANKILKQQDIDRKTALDEEAAIAAGLEGEALQTARLEQAYETYLTGPTGRFGLERTARWYNWSADAGDIADVRREKLTFNQMLLQDNPGLSRWFGLEREDLTFGDESYDAENDFHGIYYLCGAVGLVLLLAFLGYFLLRIVLALLRDFRGTFTADAVGCGLALCCGLAHAYFTAGVLRRPNATFYLAVLLAMVWSLTQRSGKHNEVRS